MTTRTINISLVEQVPQERKLYFIPVLTSLDGDLLLEEQYNVTTDETGDATIDLPVKDSGNLRYNYEIPGDDGVTLGYFLLSAGPAIDLDELVVAGGVATDNVKEYLDNAIAELDLGTVSIEDVNAAIAAAIDGLTLVSIEDVNAAIADALSGFTADGVQALKIDCGDRITPLVVASNVGSIRLPFAFTLSGIRASLDIAQASGSIFTVNVKENGTTILSTLITIDNGELTSVTAVAPAVISDAALADDALVTVDVTQVGNGTASGLDVWLIGTKT